MLVANDNTRVSFLLWRFAMFRKLVYAVGYSLVYAVGYSVGWMKGWWREHTSIFRSPPTYQGDPNAPLPDLVLEDDEFTESPPDEPVLGGDQK